jgi:hypothetical protein
MIIDLDVAVSENVDGAAVKTLELSASGQGTFPASAQLDLILGDYALIDSRWITQLPKAQFFGRVQSCCCWAG